MFIIILRDGITRKRVMDTLENSQKAYSFFPKHINQTFIGEVEGNCAIISIVESFKADDLLEIYNAEIVPELESTLGPAPVKKTQTIRLTNTMRFLHNYLPHKNMEKGRIKESWPNEYVFVDE
jgi:hypothetical protein